MRDSVVVAAVASAAAATVVAVVVLVILVVVVTFCVFHRKSGSYRFHGAGNLDMGR